MVWGIRAAVWFGITLAALALFVWCVLEMIEREGPTPGFIWGLIIFGGITLFAGAVAIIAQLGSGGVVRARDALTQGASHPPRGASGRDLRGVGNIPRSVGGIPSRVPGRSIR